jgi:flap endonuclease-1
VCVRREHNDDVKHLLRLMGVPVIEASGEAEAQCAVLAKAGLVYATATEDMDSLTFGSPRLLRHMTFSAARKMPIVEVMMYTHITQYDLNLDTLMFCLLCIFCMFCFVRIVD